MAAKTIADVDVAGRKVLMRVDFNVPLKDGEVTDDKRIVAALPSIRQVIDGGGRLILMSHLGRPAGKGFEADFSLKPVAERLAELLGKEVKLGPADVVGPETEAIVGAMADGDVLLLENVRFQAGETMPDQAKKNPDGKLTAEQEQTHQEFVDALAGLGEVYVNDAFGTCHRKHASMYGAARAIQAAGGPAVAGFLVEKEIRYLAEAVASPVRPFVAILGGAKVSDKIKLISSLLGKVDRILIGGAMAYTLLKARGGAVGKSLVEADQVDEMKSLLDEAGDKILLPCDHVAAAAFESDEAKAVDGVDIPDDLMGMDIGAKTVAAFGEAIVAAKTIVWNGPMGVFEREAYAAGTKAVAESVAEATDAGAVSVIGGGDSAAAVEQMGLAERMTHVSTGGGASLTYLEGKPMPAIEVLDPK
jgi:phosphoglycerate kinase